MCLAGFCAPDTSAETGSETGGGEPEIQCDPLPPAAIGAQYSFTATVANGDGYAQWSADGLPSGLSLDPNTGVISGVPEVVGSTDVTLSAINDATLDYCTSADGAYCDEGSAMFSQNAQTHYHYAVVAYPTGG